MNTSPPQVPAAASAVRLTRQRGGFTIGLVIGLLIGLGIALGVALYVTKAPIPFVNKVPARPPGQDAAETERNRAWDPNSGLAGRNPMASGTGSGPAATPTLAAPRVIDPVLPGASNPALLPRPPSISGSAATAALTPGAPATRASAPATRASAPVVATTAVGGNDPFSYFVQAGAFARNEDAEQQRARLAMLGVESRLTEREQGGRTVFRVRVGPFDRKEEADAAKEKLADGGVDSALVRIQR